MADWFDDAMAKMIEDGLEETGLTNEQFNSVYNFLYELGLIDYDIEKEVLSERYCTD